MTTGELVVSGDTTEVRRARRFVQDLACGSCAGVCESAVLLTSELVTNAIIHGRSEARLQVRAGAGRIRVEVGDDNSRLPALQTTDDDALDGRGLQILTTVADAWGVYPSDIGKVVWFEVSCAAPGHQH